MGASSALPCSYCDPYHTLSDDNHHVINQSKAAIIARDASKANHNLANAHAKEANYWEAKRLQAIHNPNPADPSYINEEKARIKRDRHLEAQKQHHGEGDSLNSKRQHHHQMVKFFNNQRNRVSKDIQQFNTQRATQSQKSSQQSLDHAIAGLERLKASNAHKVSSTLHKQLGDSYESLDQFLYMRRQGSASLNHTPEARKGVWHDTIDPIDSARRGRHAHDVTQAANMKLEERIGKKSSRMYHK